MAYQAASSNPYQPPCFDAFPYLKPSPRVHLPPSLVGVDVLSVRLTPAPIAMSLQLKSLPDEFAGMTVNERLVVGGQIDAWDSAARRRDSIQMIYILQLVGLSEVAATETTTAVLTAPSRYGF